MKDFDIVEQAKKEFKKLAKEDPMLVAEIKKKIDILKQEQYELLDIKTITGKRKYKIKEIRLKYPTECRVFFHIIVMDDKIIIAGVEKKKVNKFPEAYWKNLENRIDTYLDWKWGIKMKIDDFFNELIDENEELKNSIELIDVKYKVIQALYSFRKANSLSQKDFAEKIGVKQQAISRFEKGEIDPRLSFIEKVLQGINSEVIIESKTYIKMNRTLEFKSKTKKIEPSKYKLALS